MRLIDADALGIGPCKPELFDKPGYGDGWNSAIRIIQSAETVDPVKHGGWKEITYHNGCTPDYDCVCSICEKSGAPYYKYCPNCGAKMDICLNI